MVATIAPSMIVDVANARRLRTWSCKPFLAARMSRLLHQRRPSAAPRNAPNDAQSAIAPPFTFSLRPDRHLLCFRQCHRIGAKAFVTLEQNQYRRSSYLPRSTRASVAGKGFSSSMITGRPPSRSGFTIRRLWGQVVFLHSARPRTTIKRTKHPAAPSQICEMPSRTRDHPVRVQRFHARDSTQARQSIADTFVTGVHPAVDGPAE